MKKILVSSIVSGLLLMAMPVLAVTSTAKTSAPSIGVQIACMASAVNARETAIGTAIQNVDIGKPFVLTISIAVKETFFSFLRLNAMFS